MFDWKRFWLEINDLFPEGSIKLVAVNDVPVEKEKEDGLDQIK